MVNYPDHGDLIDVLCVHFTGQLSVLCSNWWMGIGWADGK